MVKNVIRLKDVAILVRCAMDYERWYRRALITIEALPPGTSFESKGLFKEVEWDTLSRGEKTSFGRYFASKVRDGEIESVIRIDNGKNRHNQYIKR